MYLDREIGLNEIRRVSEWDVVVIGGGASGLGAAIDAQTRGFRTLLMEQSDFTKGTSSRSTKLVHGGVRYLAQGYIGLVREALRERGRLHQNAPHLVKDLRFIIPAYRWWERLYYTCGLTVYDLMAGRLGFGRSLPCTRQTTLEKIPTLNSAKLRGGVLYHDGQFDDSRLAINLAQTAMEQGGTLLNYMAVTGLLKNSEGKIAGVKTKDHESGEEFAIRAKAVLNATGVFVNDIVKMDNTTTGELVRPSQGIHIVLGKEFLPGAHAIMIPKTSDGRVLFAIPWHDRVVVGTTDVLKEHVELEPKPIDEEVTFILETVSRFLQKPPTRADVKSVFAGLRPLAAPQKGQQRTKEISRGHKIVVSDSNLVTVIGGKWTTYRQMAEDAIDKLAEVCGLPAVKTGTEHLAIHGAESCAPNDDPLAWYGSDRAALQTLIAEKPELGTIVSNELNIKKVQIVWAVRHEMARTVEDVLARRTRALLLDARESVRIAPVVAGVMSRELGRDAEWEKQQVEAYTKLAGNYILT
ncbi:MAG: glycerol-3-phosphate dehydrogenase/oxidase [Bacteroidales bacterium]|jgi:glycerol-3-phosphate dehydrogenase|nr:glycerol-3-phosphate dehydrogenase/oxidase [Bacteroidales bacterium]